MALLLISHLIDKENAVAEIPQKQENSISYFSEERLDATQPFNISLKRLDREMAMDSKTCHNLLK